MYIIWRPELVSFSLQLLFNLKTEFLCWSSSVDSDRQEVIQIKHHPTSNSISEAWFPLDLDSLPLWHSGCEIPSLPNYNCPLPLLPPTLFHSSGWPTLTAPPAPSYTLKGWHQQVLRRRKHQTHVGKVTGPAGWTTLTLGSGVHTAVSLAGRSNFCLHLISGFKKICRNWAASQFLPSLLKTRQF